MEALFPIGKLAVPIAPDGGVLGPSQNLPRWEIRKPSGSVVPTGNFLDPAFANVSAVVQSHQKDMCEKPLVISVMHNRLATNPLPRHILGASREFVATDLGDRYQITDIA